jgi:hypothetical protein
MDDMLKTYPLTLRQITENQSALALMQLGIPGLHGSDLKERLQKCICDCQREMILREAAIVSTDQDAL